MATNNHVTRKKKGYEIKLGDLEKDNEEGRIDEVQDDCWEGRGIGRSRGGGGRGGEEGVYIP